MFSEDRRWFRKRYRPGRKSNYRLKQDIEASVNEYYNNLNEDSAFTFYNSVQFEDDSASPYHYSKDSIDDKHSTGLHDTSLPLYPDGSRKPTTQRNFLSIPISDCIKQKAASRRRKKRRRLSKVKDSHYKPCVVIENSKSAASSDEQIPNEWFEPFPGPIAIALPLSVIDPTCLRSRFGDQYHEGHSTPRSFVIDIATQLKQKLRLDGYFASVSSGFDVETYISFMLAKETQDGDEVLVK